MKQILKTVIKVWICLGMVLGIAAGVLCYKTKDTVDYAVVVPVAVMIVRYYVTGYEPSCLEFPEQFWRVLPSCSGDTGLDDGGRAGENADTT